MGLIAKIKGKEYGKEKIVLLLALIVCALVTFAGCHDEWDLSGKDTYEGLPVYQYDVESETVTIDGVLYQSVNEIPMESIGDTIGYIWYDPHYEIPERVYYSIFPVSENGDKKYFFAESPYYRVGKLNKTYGIFLERVD